MAKSLVAHAPQQTVRLRNDYSLADAVARGLLHECRPDHLRYHGRTRVRTVKALVSLVVEDGASKLVLEHVERSLCGQEPG